MKTTLCCMIALLTIFGQIALPHSFAQVVEDLPHHTVRVIYFLPKDRQPEPDIDAKLGSMIKDVQQFYADQMESHGFDRKTFRLEKDDAGNVVVHHVNGKFNGLQYSSSGDYATLGQEVASEINERFDTSKHIYVSVVNVGWSGGGVAFSNRTGGVAVFPAPTGSRFLAAHELGHTFGLNHNFRDQSHVMSFTGWKPSLRLSYCAAEWLDVHPYFNAERGQSNLRDAPTTIQMFPATASPPNAIRLRFKITDADGLHQAQLITPFSDSLGANLTDCKRLNGENNTTIEFVTTELINSYPDSYVGLNIIDMHGNISGKYFDIEIARLLPNKVVSIPDAKLAAAIRSNLNLPPRANITQADMQRLKELWADEHGIKTLTGIEHAKGLRRLYLSGNQISDITPLAGLTNLVECWLSNNQISDITPLTGLINLNVLVLSKNPVSDITPLTGLTILDVLFLSDTEISDITPLIGLQNLTSLYLRGLQIGDITPVEGLVNLKNLLLEGTPVQDRKPLFTLLRKNSNVEILLEYGGDPLPVTLSRQVDIEIPEPPPGATTGPVSTGNVVIPDPNLASSIRKALDLGPNASITQQAMPTLTTLDAVNLQIDDLTGLEYATQLKELMLTGNRIRNIRPLAGLTQLVVLELQDNQIKDVSPLAKLTQLETLNLNNNEIRYVSLLGGLTQLKVLRLAGNNVRNVSTLTGLVNLETLEIAENPITDIMPLAALTKLRDVDIDIPKPPRGATTGPASTDNVVIPDVNLAKAMRKALGLGSNARITKQTLQDLTRLDAEDSQIKNLTGLEHATQLVSLLFYNNPIRDIKPLAGLKKLKDLRLDENQISDIHPLAGLTQLELLHIGGNQINNDGVQILANLTRLRYLSLYGNQISNITPLTNLTQLTGLWIGNNQIRDVSPLAGLANLETLHLKGNPIQDTSLLASLAKLRDVDIEITQPAVVVAGGAFERPPMYWINANSGTLHRLVGAEVENLVPSVRNATDLAIDVGGGKLYWTERTSDRTGRIRRANLDGTGVRLVKNLTSVPHGMALDTAGGKIYLTNNWGKIQRLNVDGSNFQPNLITGLEAPKGLALDVSGGKVYWTEMSGRIRRANLNSSNIENLPAGPGVPMNIAVSSSTVYWTMKTGEERGEIRFANLTGTPNVATYAEFNRGFPIGIAVDIVEDKLYWTTSRGKIGRGNIDESAFQPDFVTGLNASSVLALSVEPPLVVETPVAATTDAVLSLFPSPITSPAIGERLTLNLNIASGEAVAGYQFTLQFDTTALRYIEGSNGDYLPTGAFFVPPILKENRVELASTAIVGVSSGDGTLATVTFEVLAAKASTLTLSEVLLSDRQGNTFRPQIEGGEVTEPPKLKVDVNGDGVVNIQDLVLVASSFGKAGQDAADVNADGVVNITDLVLVAGSLSTGLGAPSLHPGSLEEFTTTDMQEWLSQGYQFNSSYTE